VSKLLFAQNSENSESEIQKFPCEFRVFGEISTRRRLSSAAFVATVHEGTVGDDLLKNRRRVPMPSRGTRGYEKRWDEGTEGGQT